MHLNSSTRLQQVKAYLLRYIEQAQLQRNDQLPSEASIAKELGVSRNTLREAYVSLENEGVIVRRHGIGTFVAHSHFIHDPLNEFLPFAQIIQNSGYVPSFQTLSMSFEAAPADVGEVLHIPPGSEVRRIQRLVNADQRPVIFVDDFIAPAVESAGLDWKAFDGNMVQFLAASVHPAPHQIQSRIRVAQPTAEVAQYLQLAQKTPVLSVRSTIFGMDNQPITFSRVCFNSDIVELNIVRNIRT
ncbi:MAG: GntR family transcriptional regulator [Chloroflexota bacterium]